MCRKKRKEEQQKVTQRKSSHESRIKTKWMCGLDRCDSQNESKEEWKTQTTNGKWHKSDGLTEKCSLTKSKRLKWLCAKIKINSIYFHFIFHLIVHGFLFSVGDTCEDCLLFNFLLIFLLVTLIVVFECVCVYAWSLASLLIPHNVRALTLDLHSRITAFRLCSNCQTCCSSVFLFSFFRCVYVIQMSIVCCSFWLVVHTIFDIKSE